MVNDMFKKKKDLNTVIGRTADLNSRVTALEKTIKQMNCEHLNQHVKFHQIGGGYCKSCIDCEKIITNFGPSAKKIDEEINMHTEILKRLKEKKKKKEDAKNG